jgi:hypothetical protein
MADSVFVHPADTRPARHFLRRAVAFFVDNLVFQITLLLLFLLLYTAMGWSLGLGTSMKCDPAPDGPLVRQIETEWPLAAGETRNNQICVVSGAGSQQRIFFSVVTSKQTDIMSNRHFSINVDEAGNAIPLDTSFLATTYELIKPFVFFGLFIFLTAKITASGKRTPGKLLMSLRIVDTTAAVPSLKGCLTREIWKFLPTGLVAVLAMIFMPRTFQPLSGDVLDLIHAARDMKAVGFGPLIAIGIVGWILSFIWWFGPFIIWRGQTFYDRIAGCFVVRSGAANPATPT